MRIGLEAELELGERPLGVALGEVDVGQLPGRAGRRSGASAAIRSATLTHSSGTAVGLAGSRPRGWKYSSASLRLVRARGGARPA
ncbi:MAG: hypothetical protein MZV64_14775 [Ignavibacteriales bacterium]|nr:hypothetical protein [Ignavibacteriales bacterium]